MIVMAGHGTFEKERKENQSKCDTFFSFTQQVHCISVIPLSDTARNRLKGGF